MVDPIERAAENDYLAGGVYKNPYQLYSDDFNLYERGWTQAVKKSDVGLLPKPVKKSEKEFRLLFPRDKEPIYKAPMNSDEAEAYRKRKG